MPGVASSMMTHVDYDAAGRALFVTFASGRRYAYADVPPRIYEGLLAAPSKGTFFNEAIRDAYRATLLTGRRARGR